MKMTIQTDYVEPWTRRVAKSVGRGFVYAMLLSLWAALMNALSHGRALERLDTSLPQVTASSLLALPAAWFVLGVLRPLCSQWWGRMLSGCLAGATGGAILGGVLGKSITAKQLLGVTLIFAVIWSIGGLVWLRAPRQYED